MPQLALAQMSMSQNPEENLDKSLRQIAIAGERGADLILFPEIQLSPFFPQHAGRDASEYLLDLDDPAIKKLRQMCATAGVFALPNVYLKEGAKRYDTSILIDPGGRVQGLSRMVHITQAPDYYEQDYYDPSPDGFKVYATPIGRIGVVICFDRHYPESYRSCVLNGADLILIPTANMRGEPLEIFEWEIRVPAFQNSVYVAMCNRTGVENGRTYCGRSLVVDPHGEVLLRMGEEEDLAIVQYDPGQVAEARAANRYLQLYSPGNFQ